jgi:small subunit ribosomal protein S16
MSVKIRLKRVGSKNHPVYRVVVADSRSPRDGKCIEEVGLYNPQQKSNNFQLKLDRIDYWLGKGAKPSDTVASFIKNLRKQTPAPAAVA